MSFIFDKDFTTSITSQNSVTLCKGNAFENDEFKNKNLKLIVKIRSLL